MGNQRRPTIVRQPGRSIWGHIAGLSPDGPSLRRTYSGLPYGNYGGAGVGHLFGALHRHEQRLGYPALDEARVGDSVREDELSRVLLREREKSRDLFIETLGNDHR